MTNSINHLKRAGICYVLAGIGYLIFGYPFWFLGAKDEAMDGIFVLPFLFVNKVLFSLEPTFWVAPISIASMFIGAYSLWKAGEPTGFGPRRKWLVLAMIGAGIYFLGPWMPLPFAPLGAFMNGVSMILVGVATLKAKIWTDWKRYTPLAVGCFPFLFMFPLLIITGARPPAMIGLWAFPWMALGLAAWQRATELSGPSIQTT
ncbi:MAG: hypothetical protein J0I82_07265 [Spirosoma sp.]|nr:hypothetical protein [Spirosoma sp.]OJW80696.1 MAG: hypothetical protein BGO59_35115 [Spirosoma sp. 48-14]